MENRGGRRPGSGRKRKPPPVPVKVVKRELAQEIFPDAEEKRVFRKFLRSKDERIVLNAATYLCNRKHGLPHQSITTKDISEPIVVYPAEYIAAVNRALGYTGQLIPIGAGPSSPGSVIEGEVINAEMHDILDVLPE
jgi:hypothetical protein